MYHVGQQSCSSFVIKMLIQCFSKLELKSAEVHHKSKLTNLLTPPPPFTKNYILSKVKFYQVLMQRNSVYFLL